MNPLPMSPDIPLRGCPCAVLDFETTGLEPGSRWPVSVALAHCEFGRPITDVYHQRVRPPIPIPEAATAIHGIRDEDVANAQGIPEMLDALEPLLEGRVLCAYNLPYEHAVMNDCLMRRGAEGMPFFGLDPLPWAKVVDKYKRGKKLVDVCGRRGITFDAHDAAADVAATAQVGPLLLRDLVRENMMVAHDLESLAGIWAWTCAAAVQAEREFADYCRSVDRDAPGCAWTELIGSNDEDTTRT